MVFSFKSVQMRTCTVGVETFHRVSFFKIVYLSLRFLYGRVFLVVRRSGKLFSCPYDLTEACSCRVG